MPQILSKPFRAAVFIAVDMVPFLPAGFRVKGSRNLLFINRSAGLKEQAGRNPKNIVGILEECRDPGRYLGVACYSLPFLPAQHGRKTFITFLVYQTEGTKEVTVSHLQFTQNETLKP